MDIKRELLEKLYPLNRTLSSDDTDIAFEIIGEYIPVKYHDFPSGKKAFTWKVPDRWHVESAIVKDESGNKILDYKDHPLHLCSYSLPFTGWVSRGELSKHVTTNKMMPDAIPFECKYYEMDWHLCLEYNKFSQLKGKKYFVDIRTSFEKKYLRIGEYTIQGKSDDIILLIANICHPFQVNDSIAGLVTLVDIMRNLAKQENNFTYKLLICPETIGSICYLSKFESMIPQIKYGIFSEMTGIDRPIRLINSKFSDSRIDQVAEYVLRMGKYDHETVPCFSPPANDEKVLNSPGIEIPCISIVRWPYDEYHTSMDTPAIVSDSQLKEAECVILKIISILDRDYLPIRKFKGLLCLSELGLDANTINNKVVRKTIYNIDNVQTIFNISDTYGLEFDDVYSFCDKLISKGLIGSSQIKGN